MPVDAITFSVTMWNFSVVGVVCVFWCGPRRLNQTYLVLISAFLVHSLLPPSRLLFLVSAYLHQQAIFFTRLPEWTTWAILAAIALYGNLCWSSTSW